MNIGFTGTRHGMSASQRMQVINELTAHGVIDNAYHGGCVGADADFHAICLELRIPNIRILPGYSAKNPEDLSFRAELAGGIVQKEKTFHARNRDIVNCCDLLLACPFDNSGRGGTWYTIQYARKVGKRVVIFERMEG